ncbi:DNA primase family protein [Parapusillimonas sp. JC17]|uniref:DNA primase family protein n=1 Tax=Parapusillimonas sp. JC17 TaxID=3445768 RepID=UPI003FA09742
MAKAQRRFQPHDYADVLRGTGLWGQEGGVLHHWTGSFWRALPEEEAEKAAYDWIVSNDRVNASAENARKAHRAALLWCEAVPAVTTDVVIACENGYLHVRDDVLRLEPPNPLLGLRHELACEFDPRAPEPPQFMAFLDTVLPDSEVRARVQEYFGYTLTSDARYQIAQFWLGSGANGKGVLARILLALHRRPESVQLDALDGFKLSSLIDASLIYCDEAPRGRINEQSIKSLIAGERVQIDRRYRDPVSVNILAKWLVLGNHLPSITDHSNGFWRRWDIVPFDTVIAESERNPLLADIIIKAELAGVLNWALEGLLRLQRRGRFGAVLPAPMAKVLQEIKGQTDSVRGWLEACDIGLGTELDTTKDEAYAHYKDWCSRNGLAAVASPRFWPRVRDVLPYEERRSRREQTQKRVCNLALPF